MIRMIAQIGDPLLDLRPRLFQALARGTAEDSRSR
jgi:hypothetical protein